MLVQTYGVLVGNLAIGGSCNASAVHIIMAARVHHCELFRSVTVARVIVARLVCIGNVPVGVSPLLFLDIACPKIHVFLASISGVCYDYH